MFHVFFLKIKKLKEKLTRKFELNQTKINQEISIRDIFVYSKPEFSFGEGREHNNPYQDQPFMNRLIDHIEFLASTANLYHEKYYCDKDENGTRIKDNYLNKITRLSTNEFSLYGGYPLTLSGFNFLRDAIYDIAKKQQANVHLLLSSIAVRTDDGRILNTSLYVQCGEDPKIEIFSKGRASSLDLAYSSSVLFSQSQKSKNVSGFIAGKEHTVSNKTVFTVETKGGAQYTQAVDICFDLRFKHSKKLIKSLLKNNQEDDEFDLQMIPNQVDHLLTSNYIPINKASMVSENIVQIDPIFTNFQLSPIDHDLVTAEDLQKITKNKYSKMEVQSIKDRGFFVQGPSFGSDFVVSAQKERTLKGYSESLKPLVNQYNEKVKTHMIDSHLKARGEDVSEFNAVVNQSFKQLHILYDSLFKSTKPHFFEILFKTENYMIKREARAIIKQSHQIFLELAKKPEELAYRNANVLLKDLKLNLQQIDNGLPDNLIQKLNFKIDTAEKEASGIKFSI